MLLKLVIPRITTGRVQGHHYHIMNIDFQDYK